MENNSYAYTKKELPSKINNAGFILLIVGFTLGIAAYLIDEQRALQNYLITYLFILSIGVASLFVVALEYLVNAEWSVPIRRIIEFLASLIPYLIILALPLLFNLPKLYEWTHKDVVSADKILQGKSAYLNTTFFIVRTLVFLFIWNLFYWLFTHNSKKQDITKDQKLTKRNGVLSAIFIPLFAITISFTAIDWLMSLEAHWFSTIFGVYFFSGALVASLAAITLIVVLLKENNFLHPKIVDDHLYSLGALLFGFINFWGYIAFAQYLLIWYADLPEENFWFMQRWYDGWWIISLLLIAVHFVIPYIMLLSQPAKMNHKKLKYSAIILLFAHLLDLYWIVIPSSPKSALSISWIDFVFPIAGIGIIILAVAYKIKKNNLLPIGDPKLERGLNFHL